MSPRILITTIPPTALGEIKFASLQPAKMPERLRWRALVMTFSGLV